MQAGTLHDSLDRVKSFQRGRRSLQTYSQAEPASADGGAAESAPRDSVTPADDFAEVGTLECAAATCTAGRGKPRPNDERPHQRGPEHEVRADEVCGHARYFGTRAVSV